MGQETLNQGDLLGANLALTAQALLVARGHVGVQVLLPRAPVQNLFRAKNEAREGEASGQRRGRVVGRARGTMCDSRRRESDASASCARGDSRAGTAESRSARPPRFRASRALRRDETVSRRKNPEPYSAMAYPRASGRRARARREPRWWVFPPRTFPLAVILNRLAADLLVLALP